MIPGTWSLRFLISNFLEVVALRLIDWGQRLHVWAWEWGTRQTVPTPQTAEWLATDRIR